MNQTKRALMQPASQPNIDFSSNHPTWSAKFWLLVVLTGIAAGLAGGALMFLLHTIEHFAWRYHTGNLLEAITHVSSQRRVSMLVAAGIVVGVGGRIVRRLAGKPGEVNAAIWFRSGHLPFVATVAQAVHSIVIVGLGTSLGREAAVKQAGGALASRIAEWACLSRPEQRLLVACGVGAGMAAAYNVPVGGALFAVEILIGSVSMRMMLPALLCSGVATTASWILLPTGPVYQVPEYPLSPQLTAWAILVGPLLGLAAVPLIRLIGWADARKPKSLPGAIFSPLITLSLLGCTAIAFPQLLGNGKDAVQLAFADQLTVGLLLALPLLKLLATIGCLGSGASGGLFTPTMTIGALLGGLAGHAWDRICPGASMGSCAIIGSCAFLAAATHGPLSAIVLVLELTRHIDATMVPMLLAVTGAVFVVRRIELRSVYSVRLHLDRVTQLPLHPDFNAPDFQIDSTGFDIISAATGYPEFVSLLLAHSGGSPRPLFVVDETGRLLGRITFADLSALRSVPIPLEATKASDVFGETPLATTAMTSSQLTEAFQATQDGILPLVESGSSRLIGILHRPVNA